MKALLVGLTFLIFLSPFEIAAEDASLSGQLPRNVIIEVEFKETGRKIVKAGALGPYQISGISQYVNQSLLVSDGLTGTIRVGEDVPYKKYYARYLSDCCYIESEIIFKEVGTSLAVTPKIRGNYIEVSLTPQISYLAEGAEGTINVKELTTAIIAADGQPVNIGGLIKNKEFRRHFFSTGMASSLDIILTPRIQ